MTPKVVQLKIILDVIKPEIWRRILIFEGSSLRTLHCAIQDVMGWTGYHSYIFKIDDEVYSDPDCDSECEGWLDDSKYKVGAMAKKFNEFEFIYDLGDWWSHKIIFEKEVNADMKEKYPICLAGENAAPPEDCGGPHGFEGFKKAVKNPKNKPHKEIIDWYSGTRLQESFDPQFFDLEMTNLRIGRRQKPRVVASVKSKTK